MNWHRQVAKTFQSQTEMNGDILRVIEMLLDKIESLEKRISALEPAALEAEKKPLECNCGGRCNTDYPIEQFNSGIQRAIDIVRGK